MGSEVVVTSEPTRYYGHTLHADLRDGKRLYMKPTDISKLIAFCAHKHISCHALPADPGVAVALMQHLGFDTDDTAVYETVLHKVLQWVKGHVHGEDVLLKGWVEERSKNPGTRRSEWETSWRVQATKWLEKGTEEVVGPDGKAGKGMGDHAGVEDNKWTEWEVQPWRSLEQVVKSTMEVRSKRGVAKNLGTTDANKQVGAGAGITAGTGTGIATEDPLITKLREVMTKHYGLTGSQGLEYLQSPPGQQYLVDVFELAEANKQAQAYAAKLREMHELNVQALEAMRGKYLWAKKELAASKAKWEMVRSGSWDGKESESESEEEILPGKGKGKGDVVERLMRKHEKRKGEQAAAAWAAEMQQKHQQQQTAEELKKKKAKKTKKTKKAAVAAAKEKEERAFAELEALWE